jgi:hypothetical protein
MSAAEYPRVDGAGRVQIRVKAPDATKVRLNFWSGPKVDMEKQQDGFWTVTTAPLVPGFHYYTVIVDGAEVSDPNTHAFFGGMLVLGNRKLDPKTDYNGVFADPAAFGKKVHLLWIGVGTNEPERMRAGLQRLHASLLEANIQHVFYESPGTDHEWQTWRRDLKDFAPRLF